MSKRSAFRSFSIAAAVCVLGVAVPSLAAQAPGGNLIDVRWLAENLTNPDLLILDASPAPVYAQQHIPGAVNVNVLVYGGREPAGEMENLFQSWGVSPGKKLVLYDQGGTFMATRLLFSLNFHGFPEEDLLLLDGGLSKWLEAGLPVTTEVRPPAKGTFRIGKPNEHLRAGLAEVLVASGDQARSTLVEALGPDWHFGEVAPFGRPGHIPFSALLPTPDLFRPDKTFKSPEELRRMLAYLDVKPERRVYTYCGGGVAASAPFFALKFILGYPDVRLFVGSELEWLGDERELPHWTYDAPFLMRDAVWLQGWGSRMLRTYVGARMSIVDIRSPEAFGHGHVPFALNVPAEIFKSHVESPDKLADALGAAGVDKSLEAVVVSGAGLTKDAALAFLMLERAGQKRVSVLMDPVDRWVELGFVTKEPAVVGPKTAAGAATATAPKAYPRDFRGGVIIADPSSSKGIYPKVFIWSGEVVPGTAPAPDAKAAHVPYMGLLNGDGTPKAAKEIWKILSDAGVPRYGELVCFSEDPGEAASNYFILKLMGYPDVKVLWNRPSGANPR
ncbi:MAG: rhodanese-like domain-containing protein [Vicinamibacterales bacterium]